MKNNTFFIVFLIILIFMNCQKNENQIYTKKIENSISKKVNPVQIEVVRNYINWLLENIDKIYQLNTEKLYIELKKSGFLTDNYLQKQIIENKEYDKQKKINVNDLKYLRIQLNTILQIIDKENYKISYIDKNNATVEIENFLNGETN